MVKIRDIYKQLLKLADVEDAIESADPDLLEAVAVATSDQIEYAWVATLRKTCFRCLPLHGKQMTLREWEALGLSPDTIHDGWDSTCECQLVPAELFDGKEELLAPLLRLPGKTAEGLKTNKRTVRAVTQQDIQRALKARDAALQSLEGRRTLRLLGEVDATEPLGDPNE